MERGKIKEKHPKDDEEDDEDKRNETGLERDARLSREDDKRKERQEQEEREQEVKERGVTVEALKDWIDLHLDDTVPVTSEQRNVIEIDIAETKETDKNKNK